MARGDSQGSRGGRPNSGRGGNRGSGRGSGQNQQQNNDNSSSGGRAGGGRNNRRRSNTPDIVPSNAENEEKLRQRAARFAATSGHLGTGPVGPGRNGRQHQAFVTAVSDSENESRQSNRNKPVRNGTQAPSQFNPQQQRAPQQSFGATTNAQGRRTPAFTQTSVNVGGLQVTPMPGNPQPSFQERYNYLESRRVQERRDAEDRGLIQAEGDRRHIKDAITVVGTCPDMCPEFERMQRISQNDVWGPEKSNGGPVESAMVKKFKRPAAGEPEQLPSDLRPPKTLKKTLDHLVDNVIGGTDNMRGIHKFIWDRTRAIRNDFSIQRVSDLSSVKLAIDVHERIARYHLLSMHQMSHPDRQRDDYNYYQDREQLGNTLRSLRELYHDNEKDYRSPNEVEFRIYEIILSIGNPKADVEAYVQRWPTEIQNDRRIRHALRIYTTVQNGFSHQGPLEPKAPPMLAQGRFMTFWRLVKSSHTSYLMACAAESVFNYVRERILRLIWQTCRSTNRNRLDRMAGWTYERLTEELGFDNEQEIIDFCTPYGFGVYTDENGTREIDGSKIQGTAFPHRKEDAKPFHSQKLVEIKRCGRTFPAIINGLDVATAEQKGQRDESVGGADDQTAEDENSLFVPDGSSTKPVTTVAPYTFGQGATAATTTALGSGLSPFASAFAPPTAPANPTVTTPSVSPFAAAGTTAPSFGKPSGPSAGAAVQSTGSFGQPSGSFGLPSGSFGQPTGSFGQPSGSGVSTQSTPSNLPQSTSSAPVSTFGMPSGASSFGAPSSSAALPQTGLSSVFASAPASKPAEATTPFTATIVQPPVAEPPKDQTWKPSQGINFSIGAPATGSLFAKPVETTQPPAQPSLANTGIPTTSATPPSSFSGLLGQASEQPPAPSLFPPLARPNADQAATAPSVPPIFGQQDGRSMFDRVENPQVKPPAPASPFTFPPISTPQPTGSIFAANPPSNQPPLFSFMPTAPATQVQSATNPPATSGEAPRSISSFFQTPQTTSPSTLDKGKGPAIDQPSTTGSTLSPSTLLSAPQQPLVGTSALPPTNTAKPRTDEPHALPPSAAGSSQRTSSGSSAPSVGDAPAPAVNPDAHAYNMSRPQLKGSPTTFRLDSLYTAMAHHALLKVGPRGSGQFTRGLLQQYIESVTKAMTDQVQQEIMDEAANKKADDYRRHHLQWKYAELWYRNAKKIKAMRKARERRMQMSQAALRRREREAEAKKQRTKSVSRQYEEFLAEQKQKEEQARADQQAQAASRTTQAQAPLVASQQLTQTDVFGGSVVSLDGGTNMGPPARPARQSVRASRALQNGHTRSQSATPSLASDFSGISSTTRPSHKKAKKVSTVKTDYFRLKAAGVNVMDDWKKLEEETQQTRTRVEDWAKPAHAVKRQRDPQDVGGRDDKRPATTTSTPARTIHQMRHSVDGSSFQTSLTLTQLGSSAAAPHTPRPMSLLPPDLQDVIARAKQAMAAAEPDLEEWRRENEQLEQEVKLFESQSSHGTGTPGSVDRKRKREEAPLTQEEIARLPPYWTRESRFVPRSEYGIRPPPLPASAVGNSEYTSFGTKRRAPVAPAPPAPPAPTSNGLTNGANTNAPPTSRFESINRRTPSKKTKGPPSKPVSDVIELDSD